MLSVEKSSEVKEVREWWKGGMKGDRGQRNENKNNNKKYFVWFRFVFLFHLCVCIYVCGVYFLLP